MLAHLKKQHLNSTELQVLLEYVTKKPFLESQGQTQLSQFHIKLFNRLAQKLKTTPLAYLVKHQNFYGLTFFINSKVLVPRFETEILIEQALKLNPKTILDLGTGSGCLAITLAKLLPTSQVTAIDISSPALKVARKNRKLHQLNNLNLIRSDFLTKIPTKSHFDLIITNPPYIKTTEKSLVDKKTFKHEPHKALFSGPDGLNAYRTVFQQLQERRLTFTSFLGEFGFQQQSAMQNLLKTHFSGKYKLFQDLTGITRFFKIDLS